MSNHSMPWRVIQALVSAGHSIPKPINLFARAHDLRLRWLPLSVVRWLLQQGMTFSSEILMDAAIGGRVDILQLAHSARAPITTTLIDEAAIALQWPVLVWACRNGVPVDCINLEQLVRQSSKFDFPEQKVELLSMLRGVRKRELHVQADADGAGGDGSRARKSKR